MRFKHRDLTEDRIGKLPLTSLIDVVFLLLIFFMVTSRFTASESELSAALHSSRTTGGSAADFQPQVVWVEPDESGNPRFRIGQRVSADAAGLRAVLETLPTEAGVFVRASGAVPVWATAAAWQACRDAGFQKVSYVPAD